MQTRSEVANQQAAAALTATVRHNAEHNGVEIKFSAKPSEDVRAQLKSAGFRWSRFSSVWYKKLGAYSWASAHRIAGIETVPAMPSNAQPEEARAVEADAAYVQAQEDAFMDSQAALCGLR